MMDGSINTWSRSALLGNSTRRSQFASSKLVKDLALHKMPFMALARFSISNEFETLHRKQLLLDALLKGVVCDG